MKRKSKEKILTLTQPTKFFLEDVEQIYSIIDEVTESVSVENDDYEFNNLQELLDIKSLSLTNLKLVGYKNYLPQIFFFVNPGSIYIRINKDETSLLGTIEKIKEIIGARKRHLIPSQTFLRSFALLPLILAISGLVIKLLIRNQDGVFYTLLGISLFLNVPYWFLNNLPKNQIILSYSKNLPSFWKRNSDTIIVAVITSILSLTIGYIFGKITGFIP